MTTAVPPHFDTIVLSGGGVLGCAHVGFIERLNPTNVSTIVGTSVGAIVGLWLTCGFTTQHMMTLIKSMNTRLLSMTGSGDDMNDVIRLGFDSGEYLTAFLMDSLIEEGWSPRITFAQLRERTRRRLIVVICNVCSGYVEYVSAETYPDMAVVDAVRASCGIPVMVSPFVTNAGHLWIDGGVMDNYAIDWVLRGRQRDGVIGCQLTSWKNDKTVDSLATYISSVLGCLLRQQRQPLHQLEHVRDVTVHVDCSAICELFDFDCDDTCREQLYRLGWTRADEFLAVYQQRNRHRRRASV